MTPWTASHLVPLSSTISRSLLKFMSIHSVMLAKHLILCCPLLLLPLIFPSIRVFSSKSALHIMCPKYWSFSNYPSDEYSELIYYLWLIHIIQGNLPISRFLILLHFFGHNQLTFTGFNDMVMGIFRGGSFSTCHTMSLAILPESQRVGSDNTRRKINKQDSDR